MGDFHGDAFVIQSPMQCMQHSTAVTSMSVIAWASNKSHRTGGEEFR